jgi:hypothetical protein
MTFTPPQKRKASNEEDHPSAPKAKKRRLEAKKPGSVSRSGFSSSRGFAAAATNPHGGGFSFTGISSNNGGFNSGSAQNTNGAGEDLPSAPKAKKRRLEEKKPGSVSRSGFSSGLFTGSSSNNGGFDSGSAHHTYGGGFRFAGTSSENGGFGRVGLSSQGANSSAASLFGGGSFGSTATPTQLPERANLKTGEEDEEVVHEVQAKAFVLTRNEETQEKCWRELGQGPLRILRRKGKSQPRVVQHGETMEVLINAALSKESTIRRPIKHNLAQHVRLSHAIEPSGTTAAYLWKCKSSKDKAGALEEALKEAIAGI